jgi:hypothetical protein
VAKLNFLIFYDIKNKMFLLRFFNFIINKDAMNRPAVYDFIAKYKNYDVKIITLIDFINKVKKYQYKKTYFSFIELTNIFIKVDMILAFQEPICLEKKILNNNNTINNITIKNGNFIIIKQIKASVNNVKPKDIHEDIPSHIDFNIYKFYLKTSFYVTKSQPKIANFSIEEMDKYNIILIDVLFNDSNDNCYFKLIFNGTEALTDFILLLRKLYDLLDYKTNDWELKKLIEIDFKLK